MRPLVLLLFCLMFIACGPSSAPVNEKVDQKAGYKDLHLDYTYEAIKNKTPLTLTLDNKCTATKVYELTQDSYVHIGTHGFAKVELEFVLDSLYKTTLYGTSTLDQTEIMRAYRTEFGEPNSENEEDSLGEKRRVTEWQGHKYFIRIARQTTDFTIEYVSYRGLKNSIEEGIKCDERKLKKAQTDL